MCSRERIMDSWGNIKRRGGGAGEGDAALHLDGLHLSAGNSREGCRAVSITVRGRFLTVVGI